LKRIHHEKYAEVSTSNPIARSGSPEPRVVYTRVGKGGP
jgi:hypothetical protein